MKSDPLPRHSKTRLTFATIGMIVGGLAPLATGIVGVWGYLTKGYFISKTGELIDGPAGILMSGFFILAGIGMIVYAVRRYRLEIKHDGD